VNSGTASSADDFVYRFAENDKVYVIGQPQAADLTYALITALYYIDSSNQIKRVFYANAQREPSIFGKKLFKFDG